MKTLVQSAITSLTFFGGIAGSALAAPNDNLFVNAYGEPAGLGNQPDLNLIVPNTKEMNESRSRPGTNGLYVFPGTFDSRNYESLGDWQARWAAESRGRVIIGPLEVLDSGPTGPLSPEARDAASAEVTAQVLERIKATDKVMASLKSRSKSLDDENRAKFKAIANEVAERREVLRENLRMVRAAGDDQWSNARSAVAVSFNAYVQSMHQAEAVAAGTATE